jgi:phosphatidylglycerophosphate synthase
MRPDRLHMSALHWHAPDAPLRTSVIRASALGLMAVIALAWAGRAWLQLAPLYPAKVAAVFATVMAIAFGLVGDHHPYLRFGAANHVTMIRAMLVTLVVSFIGEAAIPRVAATATALAVLMIVLDGVDGWLARRSRMASSFGARFDVETDALLVIAMCMLLWQHGKAGAWVLLGGMMRYAFVLSGRWLPWMARPLRPTRRAKTVSVFNMVGVSVALAPIVPSSLSALAVGSTLIALTWSFTVDVRRLWRME